MLTTDAHTRARTLIHRSAKFELREMERSRERDTRQSDQLRSLFAVAVYLSA